MPTKIDWADESWNPITGCSPVSEGCTHCYAKRMADRLKGRYGYPADDPFKVTFHPDRLDQPLKWKKPRRIFVSSMGDLFHEDLKDHPINSVFLKMLWADWHIYLVLTKRPERMADFISIGTGWRGKMPHVWLGVTAENQARADERIPILLQIPAAKHFVSFEPLLEEIIIPCEYLTGDYGSQSIHEPFWTIDGPSLDWTIVGAETGPGARPMNPDWARSIRDQCKEAGVPFFFKKMGSNQPTPDDLMVREFPRQGGLT